MKCEESGLTYFGGVAFVALIFLLLAGFLFRFLKDWKDFGTTTLSRGLCLRQTAAFCVCELRNLLLTAALMETKRKDNSRTVRVLLFCAMATHLFVWLCCFSVWNTRLQLAFANTVYAVPSRLLRVYNISAVSVVFVLFASCSVHFATSNRPLEQLLLEIQIVTALCFVAMSALQMHLCSNFGSRLIQLVAATTKRRLQRCQIQMMTATPTATSSALKASRDESQSHSQGMAAISPGPRLRQRDVSDFEDSERELLRVATKQSVVIASAILCELLAMAGFVVLSEAGPNSLCVTPLNLFAFIALVAGVNGVVFSVYLSFIHSRAEYNALCYKCDDGCLKLATYFVYKRTEEVSNGEQKRQTIR